MRETYWIFLGLKRNRDEYINRGRKYSEEVEAGFLTSYHKRVV